jgi:tetratricopeptide (TPR) repeat protein
MSAEDTGQLGERIRELEQGLWLSDPGDAREAALRALLDAYCRRAAGHHEAGDLDAALADYEAAIGRCRVDERPALRRSVAECYVRSGYIKCLQGNRYWEAKQDFKSAIELEPDADFVFSALQKDNPRSVVANILDALYGLGAGYGLKVDLLNSIKGDLQTANDVLVGWELSLSGEDSFAADTVDILLAVVSYESKGQWGGHTFGTMIRCGDELAFSFPSDWVSVEQKPNEQVGRRRHRLLSRLHAARHAVGTFGLGYYYAQVGELLSAIRMFEGLREQHPDAPGLAEGQIERVLRHVPMAIERHIERGELHDAAVLSIHAGDFMRAAECYAQMAAGLERADVGIAEAAKLTILQGLYTQTASFQPSAEAAATSYQSAAECWEQAGNQERATECWHAARRLRQAPHLQAAIEAPEQMVLGEWDAFRITLSNTGFGAASEIRVSIEGPVTPHTVGAIAELAPGDSHSVEIALRPNEAGRRVPIITRVAYTDSRGAHELAPIARLMTVSQRE